MRDRWTLLVVQAFIGVLGGLAMVVGHPGHLAGWAWFAIFIMIAAMLVVAIHRDVHARWPAALALLAVAPVVHELASLGDANPNWWMSKIVVDLASTALAIFAMLVMISRVPVKAPDPIARVRVV
ncbi:MAG: hypothetical protein ABI867_09980 [Kofleriaceae bacterium]